MNFGDLPIDEAVDTVLAHSVHLDGIRIQKGRVLTNDDIERFRAAGIKSIVAARLEDDDVSENIAAERIGQTLQCGSVEIAEPSTGRVNIFAKSDGLCVIDNARINQVNAAHESMTIATVPPYEPVTAGQLIATVKIIPFSVPLSQLTVVLQLMNTKPGALSIHPFQPRTVGVVFSELPTVPFKGKEKAIRVLESRLIQLSGTINEMITCRHEAGAVAVAIKTLLGRRCDLVLLFGASAIVDRGDVIPEGIIRAGGEVTYFGMPVDPGNMLLLGRLGEIDAIGLPGCARSPKFNGFDWVLQRLFARLHVSGGDIAAMGVGGLLKDMQRRSS
ncbi:MAG: molybdopterin-binding protein [Gammaproteobacteria bacterium]